MDVYIKKSAVEEAVEYFKSLGLAADDSLFLFLLSKHMGITFSSSVTYGGKQSERQKDDCLNSIWMIGGLFDSHEKCGKRGILFPNTFANVALYQPGSDFSLAVGRVRDTIKQKNIPVPIYNNNE